MPHYRNSDMPHYRNSDMPHYPPAAENVVRTQYEAPAAGATVNANAGTEVLFLNPAGTLATLTVALPPSPVEGQDFTLATSQVITTLTLTGSIVGTLTTLALGGFARFVYSSAAAKWFRCG